MNLPQWRLSSAVLCLALAASCGGDEEDVVREIIGPRGGLVTSHDDRLSIALLPGALAEDTEIIIFPSDVPPPIYGAAYRVQPDIDLGVAAEVTYRRPLPPLEPRAVAVAGIHRDDYTGGEGFWQPLQRLVLDLDAESVTAKDTELSLYYGMFDFATDISGGGGVAECAANAAACYNGNVFPAGTGPRDVCFGDFDFNGIGDVAVANGGENTVSALFGSQTGALSAPVPIMVGTSPSAVGCAELSGDGATDIVAAVGGISGLVLALSNGDGTFTAAAPTTVASNPVDLALGDTNLDGFSDAVVAGAQGAVTGLVIGGMGFVSTGDRTTTAAVPNPSGVVLGNFNPSADQIRDVAVFGGNTLAVALGVGDGTVGEITQMGANMVGSGLSRGTVADVTSDGIDDIIVADAVGGGVHVIASLGDGVSFMPRFQQTGNGAFDVAVGDFDGDGTRADLAISNSGDGTITVLVRVGVAYSNAGTLSSGNSPRGLAAVDLNGDRLDDIVVANEGDNTVTLFLSSI